jgi:hypothetical protein
MMAGWFPDVEYCMEDQRYPNKSKKEWFKRTTGNDLLLCGFGERTVVIGYEGKLWALHSYTADRLGSLHGKYNDASWFADLRAPKVLLRVFRKDGQHAFKFDAWVLEQCRGRKQTIVYFGVLENVNHLLVRLQRWIRRVMMRERVRLVLLMGLHARLGKECTFLGELGHDIINGVLMRVGFKA